MMSDSDDDDLAWMIPGLDDGLREVLEETVNWRVSDLIYKILKEDRAVKFSLFAVWSALVGKVRDSALITTALESRVSKIPADLIAAFALPIWGAVAFNDLSRARLFISRVSSNVRWMYLLK